MITNQKVNAFCSELTIFTVQLHANPCSTSMRITVQLRKNLCSASMRICTGSLIEKREKLCSSGKFHDLFVLGGTTEEKLDIIENNTYLKKAFESLKKIEGDLVIYGCSIDDNDAHIWKNICDSSVNNIYIGISSDKARDRIKNHFENKNTAFYYQDENNIWKEVDWVNRVKSLSFK